MIDNRKFVRLPDNVSVRFQIITLGEVPNGHLDLRGQGQSENISEGGMLLEVNEPIPRGTFLEVDLIMPGVLAPVCLKGRVMHVEELEPGKRFDLGVQFTHFFERDRVLLEKHLHELHTVAFGPPPR